MLYTPINLDANNCLVNPKKRLIRLVSNKIRLLVFFYFKKNTLL